MAKIKCVSCNNKLAKRHCPGLNGLICPPCCGKKRLREIRCPDGCQYLQNLAYHEMKDFEIRKKKWFTEHYKEISNDVDVFRTVKIIETYVMAYNIQKEPLNRYITMKGISFLRRFLSPIDHLEDRLNRFEEYLQYAVTPLIEDQEIGVYLIPALDFLIKKFEEQIDTDKRFEEYKLILKEHFKEMGIDLKNDIKISEYKSELGSNGIILP